MYPVLPLMRKLFFVAGCCLGSSALALDNITLQLKWTHAFQFAGYYAAQEQGYYRDAGLQVNIAEAGPDTDPVRSVLAGESHYGVGTSNLLLERAAGKPVVVLAVIFQQSPYEIYAAPNIRDLHDLIGKRFMLEPQSQELLAYLKKEGVPLEHVQQITHSFDAAGLMQGKAEAISGYVSNEPFFFRQAQYPYQVFSPRSAGIDFYGDNLFTSEQELRAHPQRVKAFRAASLRGWQYAKEHRDEVIALILAKYATQYSRAYLHFESDQMIPLLQPDLIEIGYMNPNRWRHIADTYADIGLLSPHFALEGFLYDASEPDLSWLYRILAAALLAIVLISAVALYIYRINRKLQASEKANLLIQENLRETKEIAERALADQRQFIAMVSHEFRSPLAVIDSAVQLLGVKLSPESDTAKIQARIRRGVSRLTHFLDNCLTEDRLDSDGLALHPAMVDLRRMASTIRESVQQLSDDHHIAVELDDDLPVLNADPQLLSVLLLNLLGNAVKYSPPGSEVGLRISCSGQECVFEVTDQGRGIPQEEMPYIFQKYRRGRATGGIPGAGLGLSLVSRIVKLHGGRIEINSHEGKGTHVTVAFSLNLANDPSQPTP